MNYTDLRTNALAKNDIIYVAKEGIYLRLYTGKIFTIDRLETYNGGEVVAITVAVTRNNGNSPMGKLQDMVSNKRVYDVSQQAGVQTKVDAYNTTVDLLLSDEAGI